MQGGVFQVPPEKRPGRPTGVRADDDRSFGRGYLDGIGFGKLRELGGRQEEVVVRNKTRAGETVFILNDASPAREYIRPLAKVRVVENINR